MWVRSPGLSALPAELPGRSRGGTRTRDLSIKRGNRRAFDPCRLQELRTRPVEPGAGTDMGSDHGDVSIFKGVITHGRSTRTDPRPCGPGDRIESPRPGPQTLTHTPQGYWGIFSGCTGPARCAGPCSCAWWCGTGCRWCG